MRRILYISAAILLLWAGLALAATEVICIVDTDPTAAADYHSLAEAVAGEAGETPKCVTSADLVANDQQLTIECRASSGAADVLAERIVLSSFTCNSSCYVRIYSPTGHRHQGAWDDNKYVLEAYTNNVEGIRVSIPYTRIEHLQIYKGRYGSSYAIGYWNGGDYLTIDSVIVKGVGGTSTGHGIFLYSSASSVCKNSIVIGGDSGIMVFTMSSAPATITNCTIYNANVGIEISRDFTAYISNCAVFNTSDDFLVGDGTVITNCASDDGDGTSAVSLNDNADGEWAAAFTDYADGDFTLAAGSPLISAGVGPSVNASIPLYDIIGNPRAGSTCSIGAFEWAGGENPPDDEWNTIVPGKWNGIIWSNIKLR